MLRQTDFSIRAIFNAKDIKKGVDEVSRGFNKLDKEVSKSMDKIEKSTEGVEKEFKEFSKSVDKETSKVKGDLNKVAQEVKGSSKEMKKSADGISDSFKGMGNSLEKETSKIKGELREQVNEVKSANKEIRDEMRKNDDLQKKIGQKRKMSPDRVYGDSGNYNDANGRMRDINGRYVSDGITQQSPSQLPQHSPSQLPQTASGRGSRVDLEKYGQKMTSVGTTGTIASAPALMFGVNAMREGMDFEYALTGIKATSPDMTDEEYKKLYNKAKQLGADTTKSAKDVAEAMTILSKSGFSVEDVLASIEGVIMASEASGEDISIVAETMVGTINSFGLKAKEASHVSDGLSMAANVSASDVSTLKYGLSESGTAAAMLNSSFEETIAALSIMEDKSIMGSKAGTSLKGAFMNLAQLNQKKKDYMNSKGVDIQNEDGSYVGLTEVIRQFEEAMKDMTDIEKTQFIGELMGKENAPGFIALVEGGGSKLLKKRTKQIEDSDGASKKASDIRMDSFFGEMEKFSGSISDVNVAIFEDLQPAVRAITKSLGGLIETYGKIPPAIRKPITIIGALGLVAFPIISALGFMLLGIKQVTSALKGMRNAVRRKSVYDDDDFGSGAVVGGDGKKKGKKGKRGRGSSSKMGKIARGGSRLALGGLMLMSFEGMVSPIVSILLTAFSVLGGPLTLIIAGITALGFGLKYAYDHSKTFRGAVLTIYDALKKVPEALGGIWDSIKGFLGSVLNPIGDWFGDTDVGGAVSGWWGDIKKGFDKRADEHDSYWSKDKKKGKKKDKDKDEDKLVLTLGSEVFDTDVISGKKSSKKEELSEEYIKDIKESLDKRFSEDGVYTEFKGKYKFEESGGVKWEDGTKSSTKEILNDELEKASLKSHVLDRLVSTRQDSVKDVMYGLDNSVTQDSLKDSLKNFDGNVDKFFEIYGRSKTPFVDEDESITRMREDLLRIEEYKESGENRGLFLASQIGDSVVDSDKMRTIRANSGIRGGELSDYNIKSKKWGDSKYKDIDAERMFASNMKVKLENELKDSGYMGWITDVGKSAEKMFKDTKKSVGDAINSFIKEDKSKFIGELTQMGTQTGSIVTNMFSNIGKKYFNFKGIFDTVGGLLKSGVSGVTGFIGGKFNAVVNSIIGLGARMFVNVMSTWNNIRMFIGNVVNGTISKLGELVISAGNKFNIFKNSAFVAFGLVKNFVSGIVGSVVSKVRYMVDASINKFNYFKGAVVGIFNSVKRLTLNTVGAFKDSFYGIVNTAIKAINYVSDKLGVGSKIDPLGKAKKYSRGTRGHSGGAMIVGDLGPGNGKSKRELVLFPNGKGFISANQDTLIPNAPAGTQVFSGRQTEELFGGVPRYSRGTEGGGPIDKLKEVVQSLYTGKDEGKGQSEKVSKGKDSDKEEDKNVVSKGISYVGDKVSDIMKFASDPSRLYDSLIARFGGIVGGLKGGLKSISDGYKKKVRDKAVDKIKGLFGMKEKKDNESSASLGGEFFGKKSNILLRGHRVNFGYAPNGSAEYASLGFGISNHYGIDTDHVYDPVYSPMDGVIRRIFNDYAGGNIIELINGNIAMWFAHMSNVLVGAGQKVKLGDNLGISGNTGAMTTGPHLHWQVMKDGIGNQFSINPLGFVGAYRTGGIIDKKQIAVLGERGKEFVIPTESRYRNNAIDLIEKASNAVGYKPTSNSVVSRDESKGTMNTLEGVISAIKEYTSEIVDAVNNLGDSGFDVDWNAGKLIRKEIGTIDRELSKKNKRMGI